MEKLFKDKIRGWFLDKVTRTGIINPFYSAELAERMKNERKGIFYGNYDAENKTKIEKVVKNAETVIKNTDIDGDSIIDLVEGNVAV